MKEVPYRLSVQLAEFHAELERCGYSRELDKRIATWERGDLFQSVDRWCRGTEFGDSHDWLRQKLWHMSEGRRIFVLDDDPSLAANLDTIRDYSCEMFFSTLGTGDCESKTLVVACKLLNL